jgi:hypothetical protein
MNSQNLLSNVFKPSYVYDSAGGYVPKLTISNVDSIVVTSATVGDLAVGDSNSNVYIGINAGNPSELYSLCNSSNMTAIGVGAAQGNKNSANSVFIGLDAGPGVGGTDVSGSISEVAIGYGTLGGGSSNVYLGALTGSIGSGNIFIGPELSPSNVSNQLRIGRGSNVTLYSDLSTGFVGINTVEPTTGFDVSGDAYFSRKVGIQYPNPVHSLDVTGQMYATDGILIGDGFVTRPSIALVNDISTGIYAYTEGASCNFGFSVKGKRMATMSDTCLNVFGNLYVEGTFGVASSAACNTILTGYLRSPDIDGATLDISQTGIKTSGNLRVSGYIVDICTNGYLRMLQDDGTTTRFDVSDGNIRYLGKLIGSTDTTSNRVGGITLSNSRIGIGTSAPTVALEVVGDVSATTYNGPGGTAGAPHYTFSDDRTTGIFFPGANIVGLSAGGVERMRISNNRIGIGISNPTNALDVSGVLRVVGANGNITFSNGSIDVSGTPLVSTTGAFSNSNATSNIIGGVTLSNTNISYAGTITGSTANTSNSIGGVTLSNTNIAYSGTITGSTANTSNTIGGVTLSNTNLSAVGNLGLSGTITGSTANTSNSIGGVTLSNTNISYAGAITGSTTTTSNSIGGVTLSNTNISYAGAITGSTANTSNQIGGVTLSNTRVGIGNSVPTTALDVSSGSNPIAIFRNHGGEAPIFVRGSGTSTDSESLRLLQRAEWQGFYASNNIPFRIYNGTDLTSGRFTILSNGNIGVGTDAPQTRLDIAGGSLRVLRDGSTSLTGYGLNANPTADTLILQSTGDYTNTSTLGKASSLFFANSTANYPQARIASEMLAVTPSGFAANLIFQTNAGNTTLAERMRIHSNGNVGIGTTVPERTLDISSSLSPQVFVRNNATGGDTEASVAVLGNGTTNYQNGLRMFHNSTDMGLYTSNSSTPFSIITNNTKRLTILSNGNVGIGTTEPAATLDVSGTGMRVAKANALFDVTFSGNYANITTNGYFNVFNPGTTNKAASNVRVNIASEGSYYFLSNNVGIGTSNPQTTLDVAAGTITLNRLGNIPNTTDVSAVVEGSVGVGMYWQKGSNNNNCGVSFRTLSNATLAERIRIDGNTGRVGIGTTTPSSTLHVNGTLTASSFTLGSGSRGECNIPNGSSNVTVSAANCTTSSYVFITHHDGATNNTMRFTVTSRSNGSFVVANVLTNGQLGNTNTSMTFHWLVVN